MPEPIYALGNDNGGPDQAFVLFASPEMRCLGVAQRIHNYRAKKVVILRITDEENMKREKRVGELRTLLKDVGPIEIVDTRHDDPLVGLNHLAEVVARTDTSGRISVDVSTFPKNSLLLTLRTIETASGCGSVNTLYTEAANYKLRPPGTPLFGLRRIGVIPTFGAEFQPNEELLLIMLLGYERDRAVAVWQRVQPHRTVAAISRPSFRPEWDGVAEKVNAPLLAAIGEEAVHNVDPRNPWATCDFLEEVITDMGDSVSENYYVAPLGTKPQTVGVYLFCRKHPDCVSVIYGSPVAREHEYLAEGVGPSWLLTGWETGNEGHTAGCC